MKQGRANPDGMASMKREPIVHAINPGYAAQLGNHVGVARAVEPMTAGRGFMAPQPMATTVHQCGSQGKHK